MQEFTTKLKGFTKGLAPIKDGVRNVAMCSDLLNLEPREDEKLRALREVEMPVIKEQAET